MRSTFRHLLTYSLLATYASIAFLGEGLHWFTPDEHHHGPSRVVSAASDDAHNAGDSHVPTDKRVVATHGIDDHHDCEICDFLAKQLANRRKLQRHLPSRLSSPKPPCDAPAHYSPIVVGLHAPRGPPQLLA